MDSPGPEESLCMENLQREGSQACGCLEILLRGETCFI